MRFRLCFGLALLAGPVFAGPYPKNSNGDLRALRIVPERVSLRGAHASQHFLVLGKFADGLERDLTNSATLSVTPADIAKLDSSGRLTAQADGAVTVSARYQGRAAAASAAIAGTGETLPFSFGREIGPILTKRGCNGSNCHGSVKGKGGFKLSGDALFPKEDYKWIVEGGTFQVLTTDEGVKRPRIDVKHPEKSLLLQKPTMTVPHGGGRRFAAGSPDYQRILNWIESGAPYGAEEQNSPRLLRVEVFPNPIVLNSGGAQQLVVEARFSNGQDLDITNEVLYVANDPAVIKINDDGLVTAVKTGETALIVRAPGQAVSADVGVIEKPIENYPVAERRNLIDEYVFAKLRRYNIIPSSLSSDSEFLRRICLDLAGTLPPPERVREFLASKDPHKRDKLIETLLNSPEFVDYWTFRLSDLLRITHLTHSTPAVTQAAWNWVRNSVATGKPYDQIARERIAGQGAAGSDRAYYRIQELLTPQEIMAEQVRVFLGRRLDCAQCHNHPFENWSQNQFWGMTAFYGRLTEVRDGWVVFDSPNGGHVNENEGTKVIHPRTKKEAQPAFLDGRVLPSEGRDDPRMRLADWIIASPYFSEAASNRIWGYFFGRGIVEPVDDFRTTNPPTHPELLAALARYFREHNFALKDLIRLIVESRTYHLSTVPNDTNREDRINYSRAVSRPLEAAVLLDAISRVTAVDEEFRFHKATGGGAAPAGTPAVNMVPEVCPSQFMDAYGRSMRQAPPSGPPAANLLQALHMWAGPAYTTKIASEDGRLGRLMRSGASDRQIIEEFYLAALARLPEPGELDTLLSVIAKRQDRRRVLQDFVWALVSSREFAYTH